MRRRRAHGYASHAMSWWAARTHGAELDAILAEGASLDALNDPVLRQRCELRVRLLVRQSFRYTLAGQMESLIALGSHPTANGVSGTIWTVDLQLDELREASPSLRLVVAVLRRSAQPRAQGVALALLLLRDGRSPLYTSRGPGELKLAAQAAELALTSPVSWARSPACGDSGSISAASRWWEGSAMAPERSAPRRCEGDR